jgi:hypothetical protein
MGFLDRVLGKKPAAPVAPPVGNYKVQVLLPFAARLDPAAVLDGLRGWRGDIDLIGRDPQLFGVAIPAGDMMPIFAHVMTAPGDAFPDAIERALISSQTFEERHAAVAMATDSIVVATSFDGRHPRGVLLLSLLAVLDTVLVQLGELAGAAVIHWMPAQSLVTFDRYRALRKTLGPSGPAVNVRVAKVGGSPGEMFADTLGLAALGLPDLQTRFGADRDPNYVALRLMQLARLLFLDQEPDAAVAPAPYLAPPARDTLTVRL